MYVSKSEPSLVIVFLTYCFKIKIEPSLVIEFLVSKTEHKPDPSYSYFLCLKKKWKTSISRLLSRWPSLYSLEDEASCPTRWTAFICRKTTEYKNPPPPIWFHSSPWVWGQHCLASPARHSLPAPADQTGSAAVAQSSPGRRCRFGTCHAHWGSCTWHPLPRAPAQHTLTYTSQHTHTYAAWQTIPAVSLFHVDLLPFFSFSVLYTITQFSCTWQTFLFHLTSM